MFTRSFLRTCKLILSLCDRKATICRSINNAVRSDLSILDRTKVLLVCMIFYIFYMYYILYLYLCSLYYLKMVKLDWRNQ